MKIRFPYAGVAPLTIPRGHDLRVFHLPRPKGVASGATAVRQALANPVGSKPLWELARGHRRILVVVEDISRPAPVSEFVHLVLNELRHAGISNEDIKFLMALGTHRPMRKEEIVTKLGTKVAGKYAVHNHAWDDPACLEYIGHTEEGVPVWLNKLVTQADFVIGIGSIMPIEICGFTGGGKILVPGVSGQVTVDEMHWTRVGVPSHQILGKAENPIRASIDSLAARAGLNFIVNVILDAENRIVGAVAGDMIKAHRAGCRIARRVFGVKIPRKFDVVVADSFPFDIEFWQANKALDTAGEVVRKGGVVILVAPCQEGFSRTHAEMLEYGYPPIATVKRMVASGKIRHKVVGVHMIQVSTVATERAKLILVSTGITRKQAEHVGFLWARTTQEAFQQALEMVGSHPSIAVLKGASRMLPLLAEGGK